MPGRFGRLHASLPLRRNAGPSWPLTEVRPCRDTGARPLAARRPPPRSARRQTAARRANAPGRRARTAARASESTTSRPTRVGATRKSTHQRSLTTTLRTRTTTHSRPTSRASRSAPPRSASPQLPRLRLPSPPLYLRSSDRFSCSFFMVLMLLSVPSCLPPPRLRPSTLHAWAALPGVCLQVEEGGSSAKRWTPLPRKPRRRAKPGPEAGRRPVDLQGSTPRDQHQEAGPRTRRVHLRARSVGSVVRGSRGGPSSFRLRGLSLACARGLERWHGPTGPTARALARPRGLLHGLMRVDLGTRPETSVPWPGAVRP